MKKILLFLILGLPLFGTQAYSQAVMLCSQTATESCFTNNTPAAIPDATPAGVNSTINVAAPGYVFKVTAQIFITHTFAGDLDIVLTSPTGVAVTLTTDNGGANDNVFNGTLFDDNAALSNAPGPVTDVVYANLVVESPVQPEEAMAAFNGLPAAGIWTLNVVDDAGADLGTLNSWSLCIYTVPNAPVTSVVSVPSGPINMPIADLATTNSMLAVAAAPSAIVGMTVTTNVTHTWSSDLTIRLTSPSGNVTTLTSANGGSNDNVFNGTVWADNAGATNPPGPASDNVYANLVVETPLVPEGALGAFIGEDPNGLWTLSISDAVSGDVGNLASWSLDFTVCQNAAMGDPCTILCPNDVTINLEPGECEEVANFPHPLLLGDCDIQPDPLVFNGFQGPFDYSNANFSQNTPTSPAPGWLGECIITNTVDQLTMVSADALSGANQCGFFGTMYQWTAPFNGVVSFDWEYSTADGCGPFWDPFGYSTNVTWAATNPPGPIGTPANLQLLVTEVMDVNGANQQSGTTSFNVTGGNSFALVVYSLDAFGGPATVNITNFAFTEQLPPAIHELNQTCGPLNGDVLAPGVYPVCYELTELGEIIDECEFDIVVNAYAGPVLTALACNNLVQISLDANCEAIIGADLILEGGPYNCYDDYIINVAGIPGNVNGISMTYPTGTHNVTVTDPLTGNSCWGQVRIEDKIKPVVNCTDLTLNCGQLTDPVFGSQSGVVNGSATPGSSIGPDGGTVTTSTITLANPAPGLVTSVTDLNVALNINHTWIGDLNIVLTAPSGQQVTLFNAGCGNVDNLMVSLDDEAAAPLTCADVTSQGTFQPALGGQPLSGFDGATLEGNWTLTITDNVFGDGGTLNLWSIQVAYDAESAVTATDNCDNNVALTYTDTETGDECEALIIQRRWVATDDSGNTATCIQNITILPLDLANVECPANYTGECGAIPSPEVSGYPTIDGVEIVQGGYCNVFLGYWDKELADCGGGTKVVRTWTILDWCTQTVLECIQVLKLQDNEPPVITCPGNITVSSDPWFCHKDVVVPQPSVVDACGTPYTLVLNAGALQPQVSGTSPFHVINDVPVGTHIITWIATDACGNSASCTFTITVVDDIPPVAICDEHTIVSVIEDHLYDRGLTKIPATVLDDGSYDNCSGVTFRARRMDSCIDFDWTTNGAGIDEIPNGFVDSRDRGTVHRTLVPFACCDVHTTVMVELEVTDLAGNVNFCMVEVEVQDKLAPFVICPPDITVSCEFWFAAEATVGFIPQETDVLTPVFGRILDAYDYDLSDRQPIIISDPGNTQVSQPHNWGLEGWADDNCNVTIDVRVRLFDDCSGDDLPNPHPANAVRLVERTFRATDDWGNVTTCRQLIWVVDFKPFFITDQTCNNPNPNDGVIWPCDRNYTTCPDEIPVDYPTLFDDNCSIIGVEYDDQVFYFVDNACYKILRTWSVIDWCQYDPLTGEGYWQYVQVIKVVDNTGPVFTDCPAAPVTLCVENEGVTLPANNQVFLGEGAPGSTRCSVHVRLEHEVTEACSDVVKYDVKVYPNNGSQFIQVTSLTTVPVDSNNNAVLVMDTKNSGILAIRQNGLPYNDRFCSNFPLPGGDKDYHRVLWTVEDGCGNVTTCEYLLRLEDCKKPSPVCINGLSSVVMPSSGQVTIWAKDFDASSFDDCTLRADLKFSFSGTNDYPSAKFACDCTTTTPDYPGQPCYDLTTNGSPSFIVEIWVADEGTDENCNAQISWTERNRDFCTTFIIIDDNENTCGNGGAPLTGSIITDEDEPVELVKVELLAANGTPYTHYLTDKDGIYNLYINNPTANWTVAPERLDNPKNGVSTLDLVRIQKHLLGIEKFNSPYKMIAADANNSQSVSAVDIVELRKLILGIYTALPGNDSWRFVQADQEFPDPNKPWPFVEMIAYNGQTVGMDFMGIKIGDVNGTVTANANQLQVRSASGKFNLLTDDQFVVNGQEVVVHLSAEKAEQLLGYQMTMETKGLEFVAVEKGLVDMAKENIASFEQALTMSWNKSDAILADTESNLFTMTFRATESGILSNMLNISSRLTEAEAYNAGEQILDVDLLFRNRISAAKEFALYQNEPNPFGNETMISFDLPETMNAKLTLHDVTGKVVKVINGEYAAGKNTIRLSARDLPSTGVFYYTLNADSFSATKKLVYIP